MAQAPPLTLSGAWTAADDTGSYLLAIDHTGSTVRAAFLQGADCAHGGTRPYFFRGQLAGSALTGTMTLCVITAAVATNCQDPPHYETEFTADAAQDLISGMVYRWMWDAVDDPTTCHRNPAWDTWPSFNLARTDLATLAQAIRGNPNITLATTHASGEEDDAHASQNLQDTANGLPAARSDYDTAPGGTTPLDLQMLYGVRQLGQTYTFAISELAGGSHSPTSRHHAGLAVDVNVINGQPVRDTHPDVAAFKEACRTLGATEVKGPGDPNHDTHVHCAWPRR
jgi:hypothetical protein